MPTTLSPVLPVLVTLFVLLLSATGFGQTADHAVNGRVTDSTGSALPGAVVTLMRDGAVVAVTSTDQAGVFEFRDVSPGPVELHVEVAGFATGSRVVRVTEGSMVVEFTLALAPVSERIEVLPTSVLGPPERAHRIPGSIEVLDRATLESARVFNTNEALRKVTGLNVREEEGFGLRPNIGIRGTNPTRSTRVLLLEDGIPLAYAPYGDNASYYHPPIERFSSVEVLKGSGQVAYGPMTVGGVVNYITPVPPATPRGRLLATTGNRDYFNGHATYGATPGRVGFLFDYMRKQGDGSRDNIHTALNDVNGKAVVTLTPSQTLTFRGNYYSEDSNITYSGLREDEYRINPRRNPFKNDFFYIDRQGGSVTHLWALSDGLMMTTNMYGSAFHRDWWRQSSNSAQRPNDAGDPNCGGMANLSTTCGNEGRLRDYYTWGVEPRVHARHSLFSIPVETDFGVRAHFERQQRLQQNGDTPDARTGLIVESNQRLNQAYSGFIQERLVFGSLTVTPGVRIERVLFERTNRLARGGQGVTGRTDLTQIIPGVGVSQSPWANVTWFAGLHRGFAPPRTEDVINNNTGGVVELDPELSWNLEVGVRTNPTRGVRLDATWFRLDYENQIIPASVAGGLGATLTNAGETLHEGIEVGARIETAPFFRSAHDVQFRIAYTALPLAKFVGARFSGIPGFQTVSVSGNRLPYAPKHMLTGSLGYLHPSGLLSMIEAVVVGRQFADDLNTVIGSPDGQRGLIPESTLWNATLSYPIHTRATTFVTVKNVFDRTVIVDRSRGLLPGLPRLVQAGLSFEF